LTQEDETLIKDSKGDREIWEYIEDTLVPRTIMEDVEDLAIQEMQAALYKRKRAPDLILDSVF